MRSAYAGGLLATPLIRFFVARCLQLLGAFSPGASTGARNSSSEMEVLAGSPSFKRGSFVAAATGTEPLVANEPVGKESECTGLSGINNVRRNNRTGRIGLRSAVPNAHAAGRTRTVLSAPPTYTVIIERIALHRMVAPRLPVRQTREGFAYGLTSVAERSASGHREWV